jgi:hypothetical protein
VHDDPNGARCRAEEARVRLQRERGLPEWLAAYDSLYRQVARARTLPSIV